MKEKLNKAKEYAKEHLGEILIVTGATSIAIIGGVSAYKACKKVPSIDISDIKFEENNITKIFPDLGVGVVEDAMRYTDDRKTVELWLNDLSISDLGKLGDGIKNGIKDIPENAKAWVLINIHDAEN